MKINSYVLGIEISRLKNLPSGKKVTLSFSVRTKDTQRMVKSHPLYYFTKPQRISAIEMTSGDEFGNFDSHTEDGQKAFDKLVREVLSLSDVSKVKVINIDNDPFPDGLQLRARNYPQKKKRIGK